VKEPAQVTVEELIRRRLAGGEYRAAFEQVLEVYSQKIFHLALSLLRDQTLAEDLTQDVLIRIWKGLPGYHGEASMSTWIYTIARNTCRTELKRRANRPTVSLSEASFEANAAAIPTLQYHDPEAGTALDVNQLLAQIPDKYRQVLTLFYLEQKSYEQVAALLGLPLGTVKTLLYRGKRELLKLSKPRSLATA
jgi:RNA polymerase sigma-70 factor (ECF subfamily)